MLILAAVFRLVLRQAEGLPPEAGCYVNAHSIMALIGLDLAVPDHTTLVRRRRTMPVTMNSPGRTGPADLVLDNARLKFQGPGEWDRLKHGEKRRSWRKLHIAVDAGTGEGLAHELTESDASDAAMAGPLFADAGGRIRSVIVDGAYDGVLVVEAIRAAWPSRSPTRIVVPPCAHPISSFGTERQRRSYGVAEGLRLRPSLAGRDRNLATEGRRWRVALAMKPLGRQQGNPPRRPVMVRMAWTAPRKVDRA